MENSVDSFYINEIWELQKWSDDTNEYTRSFQSTFDVFFLTLTRKETELFQILVNVEVNDKPKYFSFRITVLNTQESKNVTSPFFKKKFTLSENTQVIPLARIQSSFAHEEGFIVNDEIKVRVEITNKENYKENLIDNLIDELDDDVITEDIKIPYVGLKNQGATCYMNSMLQSLFHIPAFRSLIYNMEPKTQNKKDDENICLNLQRLFGEMQLSDSPCSTKSLTKSFGWNDSDIFIQHDVQEFCRVLLDNLEEKMKGTNLEGRIADLFRGKSCSFVRCKEVDYESSKVEYFYDLQLDVEGCDSLEKSFMKYLDIDYLEGENKYNTEQYGKQDAEIGVEFLEFPKILQLHLRRFQFDYVTNRMTKLNSFFSFPKEIDLSPFLAKKLNNNNNNYYELFGILVHSGYAYGGHYFAYLKTSEEPKWYKFNDSIVTVATEKEAIDNNFGGSEINYNGSFEREFSAYMLIYVRKSEIHNLYFQINKDEIPHSVSVYFKEQKDIKIKKKEEKNIIHLNILNEDILEYNAQHNRFSFATINNKYLTSIDIKRNDSSEHIYREIEEIIGKNNIQLCLIENDSVSMILPKSNQLLSDFHCFLTVNSVDFFVYSPNELINMFEGEDKLLFVFSYFNNLKPNPIHFSFVINVTYNQDVDYIIECFKLKYNITDNNSNFSIYSIENSIKVNKYEETTLEMLYYYKDYAMIIIQPENSNIALDYSHFIDISYLGKKEDTRPQIFKVFDIIPDNVGEYLDIFYNSFVTDVECITSEEKKQISIPFSISFLDLRCYLAFCFQKFNKDFDCILIYLNSKMEFINIDDNDLVPIEIFHKIQNGIEIYIYQNTSIECFYDTVRLIIYIFLNGTIQKYYQIYPSKIKACDVIEDLRSKLILSDECYYQYEFRLLNVKNANKIINVCDCNTPINEIKNPLRFEIIPSDQLEINQGEWLIPVRNLITKSKSKTCYPSVMLKVIPNEEFHVTKMRYFSLLNITEYNESFTFSYNDQNSKRYLSDNTVLDEIASKSNSYLIVEFSSKNENKPTESILNSSNIISSTRNKSIKIYN